MNLQYLNLRVLRTLWFTCTTRTQLQYAQQNGTAPPEEPSDDVLREDEHAAWLTFERFGPIGTNEDGFRVDLATDSDERVHAAGRRTIQQANMAARSTNNAVGAGLTNSIGRLADEMKAQNESTRMRDLGMTLRASFLMAKEMDDFDEMERIRTEMRK